ncbi:unnamed protein product [Prunus armeniaca]
MTRSSHPVHAHILDFDDDFERTLRKKRKQPELNPSSSSSEPESEAETDFEEEQDMAVVDGFHRFKLYQRNQESLW